MKKVCSLIVFIFLICPLKAQVNYDWHFLVGKQSTHYGNAVRDVDTDANNFVYITAWSDSSPDFDPGPGYVTVADSTVQQGYVAVYSPAGAYVTSWCIVSTGYSEIRATCVAGNGDILVTGSATDSVDFDPGPGTAIVDTACGFVARYTNMGQLIWYAAFRYGPGASISPVTISESAGRICFGGILVALVGSMDMDPGAGVVPAGPLTYISGFYGVLDQSGNYITHLLIGQQVSGVAINPAGAVVVTGGVAGTFDFDPGPGVSSYTAEVGAPFADFFIASYTIQGFFMWKHADGSSWQESIGVSPFFDSGGNVYFMASCGAPIDVNPGGTTMITGQALVKYNSLGMYIWHTPALNYGLDQFDNPVVYTSTHLRCFNSTGTAYWSVSFNAPDYPCMAVSDGGAILMGWQHYGPADVDPGAGVVNTPAFMQSHYVVLSLQHIYNTVGETPAQSDVVLYPSVASDNITVSCTNNADQFTIINSVGQVVQMGNLSSGRNQVGVAELPNGIYFFRMESDESVVRFVVTH